MYVPYSVGERRGKAESSIHNLYEVSLFAQDETFALRHFKIFASFLIGFQTRLIALIRSEAIEGDQPPADVVRAFVWKKVSDQVPAATGNDAAPVLGVFLERVSLKRIDLIPNDAGDGHCCSPWVE